MTGLQVLQLEQRAQWMDVSKQSFQCDFYHLPAYHTLAEEAEEGLANLFLFQEDDDFVALPLLLRPIRTTPCHAHSDEDWWDATSVYGYAGPIGSRPDIPQAVLQNFWRALRQELLERRIVSAFSRLHPLIPQQGLLAGLGECVPTGQTVSIDLTLPLEVQRSRYRQNHNRDINRLIRKGVTCVRDQHGAYLDEFADIYYENMRRVGASNAYFFAPTYFERFVTLLGSTAQLFVCLMKTKVMCAGLFTLHNGIAQYHLGGTREKYRELSPLKMLLDTVRLWAHECGARFFHLGGGVGAQKDSLFHFKAGFSEQRHDFAVWRWVLFPDVYEQMCQEKIRWCEQRGVSPVYLEHFPAYRCPSFPCKMCPV